MKKIFIHKITMNKANHNSFLGNEKIKKDFLEMLNSKEIPHSWLISGIKSIGKYSLVMLLVQELFKNVININQRLKAGTVPDLLELKSDNNDINVENVREIKKFLSLTAAEQKYRVVIIDGAEQMNKHASNSLLKVLEEPPKNAIIFLITHMPNKLLSTIKSRCRHIKLHPVDFDTTTFAFMSENQKIYKAMSFGSPGKYLELNKAKIAPLYTNLLHLIANKDQLALHNLAIDYSGINKEKFFIIQDLILYLIKDIMAYKNCIEHKYLFVENMQKIAQIAKNYDIKAWLKLYEKIITIFNQTKELNLDLKQALLIIFMMLTGAQFDEQELLHNNANILR